jgi:hypothetical protein
LQHSWREDGIEFTCEEKSRYLEALPTVSAYQQSGDVVGNRGSVQEFT